MSCNCSVSLSDLHEIARERGASLGVLTIEVSYDYGKPEVLVQADLDRGDGEDAETVLLETKANTINGALLKVKAMVEELKVAGE
jgi:hypothetical protein